MFNPEVELTKSIVKPDAASYKFFYFFKVKNGESRR